jgi:2-enoate reductase
MHFFSIGVPLKLVVSYIPSTTIEAAVLCKQTGCDGIDINGAYGGYLGDQFTTDAFNKRTDEFGNSVDGKLKVLTDIIKGIKKACGKDFPVTLRFGTKHYIKEERQAAVPGEEYKEFGRDVEQSIVMAKKLEEAGYDAFLIGNGSYDSFYWLYPPMYQKDGLWLEDVAKLKGNVNIPVISPGKIIRPEMANNAIKNGMIDAVAIGRALLADPEWANKAKLGKDEAIRPCIGCNTGCVGRIFAGLPMQCAVNSNLFNEKKSKLEKAETPKKIAIIGGGIAGMEAARIAAQRGHDITIYEKNDQLGGVFIAASVPEFKDADRLLLKWYNREIVNSGVKVNYNSDMTLDQIEALDVDEIVVATGTTAKVPPIPGVNQEHVITAIEALLGEKEIGENVTIIGGGQVGCELALSLQEQGKKVTIVELWDLL